jgi:hypothetical protein
MAGSADASSASSAQLGCLFVTKGKAMKTRLKVRCIASVEEARMAVAAGPSALGLVAEKLSGPDQSLT